MLRVAPDGSPVKEKPVPPGCYGWNGESVLKDSDDWVAARRWQGVSALNISQ